MQKYCRNAEEKISESWLLGQEAWDMMLQGYVLVAVVEQKLCILSILASTGDLFQMNIN